MLKRLDGQEALMFRGWVTKNEGTLIEVEGERYLIQFVPKDDLRAEIEADAELKEKLEQADREIAQGLGYTTKEMLQAIDRGEI